MAALAALSTVSIAEARGPEGARPTFAEIDADGDGALTREELGGFADGRRQMRLETVDTDGDGAISRAEALAAGQSSVAERVERMFERLDADGDGLITAAEREAVRGEGRRRMGRLGGRAFERLDANGDGQLDAAEWDAAPRHR
jgi:Ca2+-binding EF-hand superfamily protein